VEELAEGNQALSCLLLHHRLFFLRDHRGPNAWKGVEYLNRRAWMAFQFFLHLAGHSHLRFGQKIREHQRELRLRTGKNFLRPRKYLFHLGAQRLWVRGRTTLARGYGRLLSLSSHVRKGSLSTEKARGDLLDAVPHHRVHEGGRLLFPGVHSVEVHEGSEISLGNILLDLCGEHLLCLLFPQDLATRQEWLESSRGPRLGHERERSFHIDNAAPILGFHGVQFFEFSHHLVLSHGPFQTGQFLALFV